MRPSLLRNIARSAKARPQETALRFPSVTGAALTFSWEALADAIERRAARLEALGVCPGDLAFILTESVSEQAVNFLAALDAGAVPSILSFPSIKQNRETFLRTFEPIVERFRPRWLLCSEGFRSLLPAEAPVRAIDASLRTDDAIGRRRRRAGEGRDPLFLQFSSGTTGLRKGVAITESMLDEQLRAYGAALQLTPGDRLVSWLPLYHDMGLVGAFLLPLWHGLAASHFSPFDWLGEPAAWLREIASQRATLSFLPNFAFNLLASRVDAAMLAAEGVRLDSLRAVINCSEPVRWPSMQALLQRCAPLGLRAAALQASFAMAENTFAVTQTEVSHAIRVDRIRRQLFQSAQIALPARDDDADDVLEYVSCGMPIAGTRVRIQGGLAERTAGEIEITGSSVIRGYAAADDASGAPDRFTADGWFRTGDLGYLADGELFVTGRKSDLIIHRGSNIYPDDIEATIGSVPGTKPGRLVVFGVYDHAAGTEDLVAMVEGEAGDEQELAERIRERVTQQHQLVLRAVEIVPAGTLKKSTSGKISRTANRELFVSRRNGSADDGDRVFYRLAPGVSSIPQPDRLDIVLPDGEHLSMPLELREVIERLRTPRSLTFLRDSAALSGQREFLELFLAKDVLVRTAVTDDFRDGDFAAVLRQPRSPNLVFQFRGGWYDVIDGVPPREFARLTGLDAQNLVMLRDLSGYYFLQGVGPELPTFEALVAWLRGVERGMPEITATYCMGTSMGGYAAILAGHRLRARTVWAFGPRELRRKDAPTPCGPTLAEALASWNGVTAYHVYYGERNEKDRQIAGEIGQLPGVHLHPWPTDSHFVAAELWKANQLPRLFPRDTATVHTPPVRTPQPASARDIVTLLERVVPVDRVRLDEDTNLRGLLDSFASTRLVSLLADTYGRRLDLTRITDEDLSSVSNILSLLQRAEA